MEEKNVLLPTETYRVGIGMRVIVIVLKVSGMVVKDMLGVVGNNSHSL